jgi:hypothetical protein
LTESIKNPSREIPSGDIYCDTRLGGIKRWYYGKPKNANMRVDDNITKCVCFLSIKVKSKLAAGDDLFIGTAFIMHSSDDGMQPQFTYLVTAKHVIEDTKAEGHTNFYARFNTLAGGSEFLLLPDEWIYHDNPAVDVAVLAFNIDPTHFDYFALPSDLGINEASISARGIGIGDLLLVTGLFNRRWGQGRNTPIARSGTIAAMPDPREPFVADSGEMYNAYLAEVHSISGLSGSPVFVLTETERPPQGKTGLTYYMTTLLLGMIRGHWDLEKQDAAHDAQRSKFDPNEVDRLNGGIAVVTPIQDVVEIINGEPVRRKREQIKLETRKIKDLTLDSNLPNSHE